MLLKIFLTLFVARGRMMTEKKECKSYGEVSGTVNGEKQRIESSAIYYIEVRGHWLYLHLHNQTLEVSGSLQEIEDRLKDQQFSRCSNSYLVNLRHVDAVKKDSIVVGANTLPLSRGRRNTFLSDLANSVTGGNMK